VSPAWRSYSRRRFEAADGSVKLSPKFTRLTRTLADPAGGQTPTDRRRQIVARRQPGHWARSWPEARPGHRGDLVDRIAELTGLLEPGAAPYSSTAVSFSFPSLTRPVEAAGGRKAVVQRLVRPAPIDGVVVSAGIPDLEESRRNCRRAQQVGQPRGVHAGHHDQIKSVIKIATEVRART